MSFPALFYQIAIDAIKPSPELFKPTQFRGLLDLTSVRFNCTKNGCVKFCAISVKTCSKNYCHPIQNNECNQHKDSEYILKPHCLLHGCHTVGCQAERGHNSDCDTVC